MDAAIKTTKLTKFYGTTRGIEDLDHSPLNNGFDFKGLGAANRGDRRHGDDRHHAVRATRRRGLNET